MITIYEILEVEENASKEEIEKAYSKLILEFRQDPNFDEETNKENEAFTNKLKIAYEILSNDEKRKRYDNELAKKRAESLIAGVVVEENNETVNEENANMQKSNNRELTNENISQRNIEQENNLNQTNIEQEKISKVATQNQQTYSEISRNTANQELLSEKEKHDIRKAAKKEFNNNLKKVKQAEAEYNEAYNKAYNEYLRKNGYKVEEPLTLRKILRVFVAIIIMIVVCIVLWCIPPIRNLLIETYNNNFIIKAIVDLIKMIFEAIIGIF